MRIHVTLLLSTLNMCCEKMKSFTFNGLAVSEIIIYHQIVDTINGFFQKLKKLKNQCFVEFRSVNFLTILFHKVQISKNCSEIIESHE